MMQLKPSLAILIPASTVTGCDAKDWDARGYARGAKSAAEDVQSKGCANLANPSGEWLTNGF
jgi:hypothetical protein